MSIRATLKEILKQPYPFYFEGRSLWVLLAILAVLGVGFHYLFQPFNVYLPEHKMSYFNISLVHTGVALAAILLCSYLIRLFPSYISFWTVGKEFLFLSVVLLVIGVSQFLIRDLIYDNPNNWSMGYLLEEIRNTYLVGILFVLILVPLNFNRLSMVNRGKAAKLSSYNATSPIAEEIFIKTQLKQDDFNLDPTKLVYAKAEGNYIQLVMDKNGAERLIKRISLKNFETQLKSIPYITRTHRSFLVNLNYIDHVSGNAQGYTLALKNCEEQIAVSRKMIPEFERALAAA